MGLRERLADLLIKHEGLKTKPYHDTVGKLTIGIGRNLDDRGISIEEALFLLEKDISNSISDARRAVKTFDSLNETRQVVVVSMAFNLGLLRLQKFSKMISAIEASDFNRAASEMLSSAWAAQVGKRSVELAQMMKAG